ncbi:RnfABCDGE type electron transport complex subunit D [Pseudomonas sp. ABC1]|uniref:RnfABCDGE type electron transport complex subunit D n=1 Tax=Pseudomonas sp. ABC1 TaxID=2748080 RepID=UPI0015C310F2|nr:RnfABCDGE type electron transport complex subunit D [Pseudomonas sp. ABC1]QLF94314.1 RnfABCDGE type electron transport complex subunit D [Pseudomonas sp. ABC1]
MNAALRARPATWRVMIAALPGLCIMVWLYGAGPLSNLLWASLTALACEAWMIRLRGRAIRQALADGSALLTALLLALALPPYSPWWLVVLAATSAIVLGKQLYGGVGQNPFNPAMVGYAVALVAFPMEMSHWSLPHAQHIASGLERVFGMAELADGWSQATALNALQHNDRLTLEELWQAPIFGQFAAAGSEWVNLAFLAGGLWLLRQRLYSWHAPLGMLAALGVMSLLFWNGSGSDGNGSPLFHLLSGATMLGAFFIVTDPISGAGSPRGRLLFGIGVGVLVYVIRAWGGYPDGLAFAVLLMNLAAPTIDHCLRAAALPKDRA